MPRIEVSTLLKNKAAEVYGLIKNMEAFPDFMRDVKSLKIVKALPDKIITAWEIEIEGAGIKWKEEDIFDEEKLELNFSAIEGDYKEYQGKWKVTPLPKATKLSIEANFDWGIPVLEKYVGKTLEKRARLSLTGMLLAIKNKLEKQNV